MLVHVRPAGDVAEHVPGDEPGSLLEMPGGQYLCQFPGKALVGPKAMHELARILRAISPADLQAALDELRSPAAGTKLLN